MTRWSRPGTGRLDDSHAVRYAVAVAASLIGLAPLLALAGYGARAGSILFATLFTVVWGIGVWRTTLIGVYVSDHGIKIRMVLRTHFIDWPRVTRVWAGQAAHHDAWQIWVSARDPERDFETPLWREGSRVRHHNRCYLPPDEFAAVLTALNSRVDVDLAGSPHRRNGPGQAG